MNYFQLSLASVFSLLTVAAAEPLVQDGFESGLSWSITKTNDGRARVISNDSPAAGASHLLLDDAIDDAVFSVAEASISLDLTDRKNVTLSFMAKNVGNEGHAPPSGNFSGTRSYDGVAISCDGGLTWRNVQSLATLEGAWTAFSIPLDSSIIALGGSFAPDFRIRFSAYDNSAAPLDGIAIDSVEVTADFDPRVTVEIPGIVAEGSGPQLGYVSLNAMQAEPLTVTLSAASPALALPASVTIPAGSGFASFEFSAPEDSLVTFARNITVNAAAAGFSITPGLITVTDNESVQATLTLPAQVTEGSSPSNNSTLEIVPAPSVAVTVTLTTDPAGELALGSTITVPAGQSLTTFTTRATNDARIDGDIPVTVKAHLPGLAPLSGVISAVDNDLRTLNLTVAASIMEGGSGSGTVSIPGTLPHALQVNLLATGPGDVSLPAYVTIPAGFTQTSIPITGVDNNALDGSRSRDITVSATGFTAATKTLTLRDNDAASYSFSALTDLIPAGIPQNLTITAQDVGGNTITGYSGELTLELALPDGSTLPVSPASITLGGAGWTGQVTLPATTSSGLRLRVSDAQGHSSFSPYFDPIRTLDLATADLVWNPVREVIYASVPTSASGPYAGCVVEIDPATAEIRRSVLTIQNPGQLALTSGGEYLYAAQSGNGRVAKIDPVTMSVISSFDVGFEPGTGTFLVSDMCTVAGQPELLVVSRRLSNNSPTHRGVAVFDNGVKREVETQEYTDSVRVEPSSDPTRFWCYTPNSFSRLSLDAIGISVAATTSDLGSSYGEIKAAGDTIYGTSGGVINGLSMTKSGTIATNGPMYPDATAQLAYFIERGPPANSGYNRIGSYSTTHLGLIRRATMPSVGNAPGSLIRWGNHGLAFRNATTVYLVGSSTLVGAGDPADLAVTVAASPAPVMTGGTLTYTVQVTNQGPNIARGGVLSVTLSTGQTLQGSSATSGNPTMTGSLVTLMLPDMPTSAQQTLTLTVQAQPAGSVSCTGKVVGPAADPEFSNNIAARLVSVGYQTSTDSLNQIRLAANSLVVDPTRNLLWAAMPSSVEAPFGNSLVSIDPLTGVVSDPIPLGASPRQGAIALSSNGRYLYLGLSNLASIARIDLAPATPLIERIPMESAVNESTDSAAEIEVLDGDGTSILVASGASRLHVIDGLVPRGPRTNRVANNIERTATPGVYFGFDSGITSYPASLLRITTTGVEMIRGVDKLMPGIFLNGIEGAGDRILSGGGHLVDSTDFELITTLPVHGIGCVDSLHRRAYILNGNMLRSFDSDTGEPVGSFPIQSAPGGGVWGFSCHRWGTDGIAILGNDGRIQIGRWSLVLPALADSNADGIPDDWATAFFGTIEIDPAGDGDADGVPDALEYLFATSPIAAGASPLSSALESAGDDKFIVLRFPRRAGLPPDAYHIQISDSATAWVTAPGATQSVLSTATVDGVSVENVEARIPMPSPARGFARIQWQQP
jgi:uncharacterized repeat protein (TIGR01451 family)